MWWSEALPHKFGWKDAPLYKIMGRYWTTLLPEALANKTPHHPWDDPFQVVHKRNITFTKEFQVPTALIFLYMWQCPLEVWNMRVQWSNCSVHDMTGEHVYRYTACDIYIANSSRESCVPVMTVSLRMYLYMWTHFTTRRYLLTEFSV